MRIFQTLIFRDIGKADKVSRVDPLIEGIDIYLELKVKQPLLQLFFTQKYFTKIHFKRFLCDRSVSGVGCRFILWQPLMGVSVSGFYCIVKDFFAVGVGERLLSSSRSLWFGGRLPVFYGQPACRHTAGGIRAA